MLPKEKVYVGNMIDTIPQRWHEGRGIVQAGRRPAGKAMLGEYGEDDWESPFSQ